MTSLSRGHWYWFSPNRATVYICGGVVVVWLIAVAFIAVM